MHDPAFDALIAASLEQCDGGSVTIRVRNATSASALGLSGPGGFVPSSGPRQSWPAFRAILPRARFRFQRSSANWLPAPTPSRHRRMASSIAAGQATCALGNPTVNGPSAVPNIVQVCASTSVTPTASSRRATELTLTRADGTVVGGPVTGTNPCGSLTVSATVPVTGQVPSTPWRNGPVPRRRRPPWRLRKQVKLRQPQSHGSSTSWTRCRCERRMGRIRPGGGHVVCVRGLAQAEWVLLHDTSRDDHQSERIDLLHPGAMRESLSSGHSAPTILRRCRRSTSSSGVG